MRNPKLVTDLKPDIDSKNAGVRLISNWWAIQLYKEWHEGQVVLVPKTETQTTQTKVQTDGYLCYQFKMSAIYVERLKYNLVFVIF